MKSDEQLIDEYLEQKILDECEDETDEFFRQFDVQTVVNQLINRLRDLAKTSAYDEPWKLGRSFGDIDTRYPVEIPAYLLFLQGNSTEKSVATNFLEGFWDQYSADWDTLIQLSTDVKNALRDFDHLDSSTFWTHSAIAALTTGCASNKYRLLKNETNESILKNALDLSFEFTFRYYPESHHLELLRHLTH
jgi:hypothetical protein